MTSVPQSIHRTTLSSQPRQQVALVFTSKDRTEFSHRTLPPLAADLPYDLFWMDGSRTPEGQRLPEELAPSLPRLREVHYGVTGGPDAAIVYALSYLLDEGYDYIGLIENDVLLDDDWFQPTMDLFERGARDGLRVGAVSARSFVSRRLLQRPDYAVLYNIGAAMIIFRREAARIVLSRYRTTDLSELDALFKAHTGIDLLRKLDVDPESARRMALSTDCYYDAALFLEGYCSLGLTPWKGINIDLDYAPALVNEIDPALIDDKAFADFSAGLARLGSARGRHATAALPYRDPQSGLWIAFPHQLTSIDPSYIQGNWKLSWSQSFGPFVYVAQSTDCTLDIPVHGSSCALFVGVGPDAGIVEIIASPQTATLNLNKSKIKICKLPFQPETRPDGHIRLRVLKPPFSLVAVETSDLQVWHQGCHDFNFHTIASLL